jgi:ATP phosphoribosyltransferase regulatory subunit
MAVIRTPSLPLLRNQRRPASNGGSLPHTEVALSRSAESALLPAGLQDVLPPDAAHEAATVERLMGIFAGHGYQRVKPPLVEFEESLLSGPGAAMAKRSFRLMDPVSHRMLAVRADMTLQVARIAATRLSRQARPLRLSYAGQVLRVKGSNLRPERQFGQAGVELIGTASAQADAEVILLAAEALNALGVRHLSIDLNVPLLVSSAASGLGMDKAAVADLVAALDRRDAAAVNRLAGSEVGLFRALLRAAGSARPALAALAKLDLPADASAERERLAEVVDLLLASAPKLVLTVDPVEHRGLEYHRGVGFTLLARKVSGELGRGGRYVSAKGEASTGFTLYLDTLLRAVPAPRPHQHLYLPAGTTRAIAAAWRAKGWATIAGVDSVADDAAEARRLGCSHLLQAGRARALPARRSRG